MTRNEKKLARALAVRYEAWVGACTRSDRASKECWGPMLEEVQTALGIQLAYIPERYRKWNTVK